MRNMWLAAPDGEDAAAVVAHFGAMQSQDYGLAKWSIAQRSTGLSDETLDAALASGTIIRTHVLRPTWHFVARDDAPWILTLSGPRVLERSAPRLRQLELDARTLTRLSRAIARALEGGNRLTRAELKEVVDKARIDREGQRLPWALMYCELKAIICSGGLSGKQQTYALFDEMVPGGMDNLGRDEALTRLLRRYLGSHGPATAKDFHWWSGFTIGDIKGALSDLGSEVHHDVVDGVELYSLTDDSGPGRTRIAHLLQPFDEYVVGYTESRFVGDPRRSDVAKRWGLGSSSVIVMDGNVVGYWRRILFDDHVTVNAALYEPNDAAIRRAVQRGAKEFARFLGRQLELEVSAI